MQNSRSQPPPTHYRLDYTGGTSCQRENQRENQGKNERHLGQQACAARNCPMPYSPAAVHRHIAAIYCHPVWSKHQLPVSFQQWPRTEGHAHSPHSAGMLLRGMTRGGRHGQSREKPRAICWAVKGYQCRAAGGIAPAAEPCQIAYLGSRETTRPGPWAARPPVLRSQLPGHFPSHCSSPTHQAILPTQA